MGQKWPNVRISANFFTKPGFYKDSKKLLGNIYVDYENTFGAYVGILSGFYLDYKKRKPGFYRDYKNHRKMAMGFYMDSKKTQRKVV